MLVGIDDTHILFYLSYSSIELYECYIGSTIDILMHNVFLLKVRVSKSQNIAKDKGLAIESVKAT